MLPPALRPSLRESRKVLEDAAPKGVLGQSLLREEYDRCTAQILVLTDKSEELERKMKTGRSSQEKGRVSLPAPAPRVPCREGGENARLEETAIKTLD